MKKHFIWLLALLCGVITGCSKDNNKGSQLEGINLNQTNMTIGIGESQTLIAETIPADLDGITFSWTSSDASVASVDNNGTVTGIAVGEAMITVSSGEIKTNCKVIVSEEGSNIQSVTINPAIGEVLVGETMTLQATVEPKGVEYTITWKSSDESVATVASDGTVTGVAKGNVIIYAEAGDKTGECRLAVVNTPVESITINQESISLEETQSISLSAAVLPENADNKSITWSSSDERVAIVDGAGKVTAIGAGEAVITAQAGNVTDECSVTVTGLPLAVGDYYYSDGTWSTILDNGKEAIGVVFYVGDVTTVDPILAKEHPECRHGLVVSLSEGPSAWQSNYAAYNNTVGAWVEENLPGYITTVSGDQLEDNINKTLGYNNTKAIEAFNAAPENSGWPVEAVQFVVDFREDNPTPEHCSGWYLPSAKDMSLCITGEYDGNIWEMRDAGARPHNMLELNEKIELIPGATPMNNTLVGMMFYWTSSEMDAINAISVTTANGQTPMGDKAYTGLFSIRPILAF